MKTREVKPKSGTHFEQVPVEVVKKIIGGEEPKETARTDNQIIERVPVKAEPSSMASPSISEPGC